MSRRRSGNDCFPALILALVVAAAGCRAERPDAPRAGPGATIVVASAVDMRGVNELTAGTNSFHTALHYYALFLPLLEEQADYQDGPPSFAPRLADSFAFSEDRRVLTFKLRRGVVWSDGVPVTAADVRWTWQAQTHPQVAWSLAETKRHIRDVEALDARTVRFHFDKVYAAQLLDAVVGVVLPRHAWSRLPFAEWRHREEWFRDNLVVNGPFTLESWKPGQHIVLRRNGRFFDRERPRAERIVFRITPDRTQQLALLRSGAAHMASWARPADVEMLLRDPDLELLSYTPRGAVALVWNTARPLFAERRVRQALTMALDRRAIVDTLHYGYANVTDSPFPTDLWAHNRQLRPWPYDPRRAAELLAAAGWSDSDGDGVVDRGGERFSFEILTTAGNELRRDVLVMVQDQLARIGVEARQRHLEFNTLLARERRHDFAATCASLGVGTDLDFSFFFHSRAIDGGYNFGAYSNPEVDRLLDELRGVTDQVAAKPIFYRLQEILREDVPLTILYEPRRLVPVRRELANVSPNALSAFFGLQDWELRGAS